MEQRVRRDYACEVRAENDEERGNYITGMPIVIGAYTDIGGWFREVIEPGALDNTDLRDVRFLVNHNLSMIPLARSRNNNANSTMQLTVLPEGLRIRADLDTERNDTARSLYSAVDRGDITGMSFMFTVNGEKWDDLDSEYPTRHVTSIGHVFEVSAVTDPAYAQTVISARSDADALESARALLESSRKAEERLRKREAIESILEELK